MQGQQTDRHASDGMKERARGFTAKVRNKLQHALNLNGNITEYEVYTPSSRKGMAPLLHVAYWYDCSLLLYPRQMCMDEVLSKRHNQRDWSSPEEKHLNYFGC